MPFPPVNPNGSYSIIRHDLTLTGGAITMDE